MLLGVSTILVYLMIKFKLRFLPESIAFLLIGFFVGLVLFIVKKINPEVELQYQERFDPNPFFLLLLPPIIFESGYSLHKGNFFKNIGSIVIFAVLGTAISAIIVGGGLFSLSKIGVVYELNFIQSFTFGALISAVDPVATLAIFHALEVNPTLNMLVFGESVLNDAVAIVMTKTIMEQASSSLDNPGLIVAHAFWKFIVMFCGSALLGIVSALASALVSPSLSPPSLPFTS
jgi:sodium/hydrogen exchanger 8